MSQWINSHDGTLLLNVDRIVAIRIMNYAPDQADPVHIVTALASTGGPTPMSYELIRTTSQADAHTYWNSVVDVVTHQ